MVLFICSVGTVIARPGLSAPRSQIGTESQYGITQSDQQDSGPRRRILLYRHYVQAEPAVAPEPAVTPIPFPQPVVVAPVAPFQPVGVQPESPVEAQPAQATSAGRGLLIAGIIIAAGGTVGGVGSGVVFGLRAASLDNDAKKLGGVSGNSKSQDAKAYRNLEYVSFGVASASFVVGGALIIWGIVRRVSATSESPPQPVAVVPIVGPGLGGAALSASF